MEVSNTLSLVIHNSTYFIIASSLFECILVINYIVIVKILIVIIRVRSSINSRPSIVPENS